MKLKEGKRIPAFRLLSSEGREISSKQFTSDYTVLYFYPKDDTPGCTLEAKEFSEHLSAFKKRNVAVFGISGLDEKSKAKFCKKHGLSVPLLADPDFKVASKFGVYGEKRFMGRTYMGVHRCTFVLDKRGKIVQVFETVKPAGHALEVLQAIDSLSKKKTPLKIEKKTVHTSSRNTRSNSAHLTRKKTRKRS